METLLGCLTVELEFTEDPDLKTSGHERDSNWGHHRPTKSAVIGKGVNGRQDSSGFIRPLEVFCRANDTFRSSVSEFGGREVRCEVAGSIPLQG